ncbi:ABC transporter ATP-binding protein [Georgenia sp. Z1344]|uniref:ABC transporter ATP-binding protein n=1 Tax=Georgenia sp. Z1344 TaxID=3416706 RepID=UPI003CECB8E1
MSHDTATRAPAGTHRTDATPPGSEDVIVARRLSTTFSRDGVQQHVLKNLDLTIRRGDLTVIMGPSGAGKSTLLYALSGMDRPSLGTVTMAGTEISSLGQDRLARFRRRHCGFVFQQVHLLDGLSVLDNVLAVGLLVDRDRRRVTARARELLEQVGLAPADHDKLPSMLSGGEAQRAAVVRALVNSPDVVFADEPTGALNTALGGRVLDQLTEVNAGGQTIVMVTHDTRSALRGNRILYLRDGTIDGELELGRWTGDDDARRERLTAFLTDLGW